MLTSIFCYLGKAVKIARKVDVQGAADCIRCVLLAALGRRFGTNINHPPVEYSNRYYGGWADKTHGKTIEVNESKFAYTRVEPYGQVSYLSFAYLLRTFRIQDRCRRTDCPLELPSLDDVLEARASPRHRKHHRFQALRMDPSHCYPYV